MRVHGWVKSSLARLTFRYRGLNSVRFWAVAAALTGLALPVAASAMSPISQGYATDEKLVAGTMVSLKKDTSDFVVAAKNSNVDNLLGVVVNGKNTLLSVKNSRESQVLVATSGTEQVLVSDINGEIARGDQITASPIGGVGMKATGNIRVIGTAQTGIQNGKKQTYKNAAGEEKSATFGEVSVLLNVAYYFKEPDKTIVPSALQNIANSLAGKTVDSLPIIISAAIFIIMIIVVVSIVYSMIKSSIISVGRNPLSQGAIYRGLIQLSALVLVILGVGFSSIYMVLTRI